MRSREKSSRKNVIPTSYERSEEDGRNDVLIMFLDDFQTAPLQNMMLFPT